MFRSTLRAALFTLPGLAALERPATAQVTIRASVDSGGNEGNGNSRRPAPSADGHFIAFVSDATNLVPNDTNAVADVFVHDTQTGATERVSVDASGNEANAFSDDVAISADGRFVAFTSAASNLVPGVGNGARQAFLRDRKSGTVELVSCDSTGAAGNLDTFGRPAITPDGRFVVFETNSTNFVGGSAQGLLQVYVRDRSNGTTEIVSVDSNGNPGLHGGSYEGTLSSDGRFVVFGSDADKLVANDLNSSTDLFLRDRQLGTTVRVSVDANGAEIHGDSFFPSLSADGRFVSFESWADELKPDTSIWGPKIYVRDLQTGVNEIVSVDANGNEAVGECDGSSISADGRFVAYVGFGTWNLGDVYVYDRKTGKTAWASADPAGNGSDGDNGGKEDSFVDFALSADGQHVAFWTDSTDLVAGPPSQFEDVVLHGATSLTLTADPASAPAGALMTFDAWSGAASGAVMLVATNVDGVPNFIPVLMSAFDVNGLFSFSAIVPFGLTGHVVTLQSFGLLPTGKLGASNSAVVTFQ